MHNKPLFSESTPKNNLGRHPGGDPVPEYEDENRIDWDRKQRHKRKDDKPAPVLPVLDEPLLDDLEVSPEKKNGKKDHRKKRRQYIYDEELGQVVVKRRRRKSRHANGDLEDEWG
ncbi:MAG: hypothetical protein RLP44_12195 [Aggregatilineales bacterium]